MHAVTTWLSRDEKDAVYQEALLLLEHVGLRMTGSRRLEELSAAGATVDAATGVVRLPAELVDRLRRQCPREIVLGGAAPENDVVLHDGGRPAFSPSGCAALTLDHRTGEHRPSTLDDLRAATILLDETPELDVQWTTVTASDVPLEAREKLEYYTVLTETDKHVTFVDCPSAIEPVLQIAEVLCGSLDEFRRRPRISTLFTVASPLSLDGHLLDFHAGLADYGTPIEIYTVPISGATAPVTLAGVVVQGVAELLGAVAAMQILSPGSKLICGPSGAILDMRSTSICYGALEGGLLNAAFTEVLHHLGLPVTTPGLGTDAKHLGVQDGFEKALKAIVTVAAGSDLLSGGMGLIDSVNTLYLPQIVVDAEIVAMIRRLLGEVEFSPETMAREMIERVGIGGNFLKEKVTRQRIKAGEHFVPRVASRLPYDAWRAQGTTEVDVAIARVEEILAARAGRRPNLSDDQIRALRRICAVDEATIPQV
ncbi:MAG TPA: trimethylamine methyltransferase family protein [Thermoleophilia bacterium]|nr:trimethylamine methyltransferase family protein [Thermoleophilia bacterium]